MLLIEILFRWLLYEWYIKELVCVSAGGHLKTPLILDLPYHLHHSNLSVNAPYKPRGRGSVISTSCWNEWWWLRLKVEWKYHKDVVSECHCWNDNLSQERYLALVFQQAGTVEQREIAGQVQVRGQPSEMTLGFSLLCIGLIIHVKCLATNLKKLMARFAQIPFEHCNCTYRRITSNMIQTQHTPFECIDVCDCIVSRA